MRKLLILLLILAVLFTLAAKGKPADGDIIKIHATDAGVHPMVEVINARLADQGLTIIFVDTPEEADVRVLFVDPAENSDDAATAYPYDGRIEIVRGKGETGAVLFHELLHCAGLDHEDNSSSVMYRRA